MGTPGASAEEDRRRYDAFLAVLPDAVIEIDPAGVIRGANPAACRLFNLPSSESSGKAEAVDLFAECDRTRARSDLARVCGGESIVGGCYAIRHPSGYDFPAAVHAAPVFGHGAVLFIRDARCASAPENEGPGDFAGQEAQRTESLGVLAAGIAHDFNNLLMGVLGNADLAMDDIPRDSPARVCVAAIQSSAKRAAEICRQLVAYSGRSTYALEPVNLSALVGDMRHLLTVSVAKTVVLRFDLSPHVPEILGDPAQLRHLVLNLVVNASDSIAGRSGVVSVTTGVTDCDRPRLDGCHLGRGLPAGRFVFIEVADTGRGMDPATLARVFDPFFTTKGAGRGLGLPAVAGIVRAHKGAIRVHSEVGRGTTFKVLLPGGAEVARSPTGDATMSRQAEACGRGKGG